MTMPLDLEESLPKTHISSHYKSPNGHPKRVTVPRVLLFQPVWTHWPLLPL